MTYNVFVINPGSTSTKIAMYRDNSCLFEKVIRHDSNELSSFSNAADQFEYRFGMVRNIVENECNIKEADAFAGRGGLLRPLKGGTYIVDDCMLDDLKKSRFGDHASNLGAIIAQKLASQYGKKAYVVNPVVVDELMDLARLSGIPAITRKSAFHALNQKAAAMRTAREMGIQYEKGSFIVAHLGGGISVGAHYQGKVIDVNNGLEEGPFSPERAGSLPTLQLVDLCFSGQYTRDEIRRMLVGEGGLKAYTGTTDCRKLEEEMENNKAVKTTLDAMVYRISREICASGAALYGNIHRIVITGGLAYSSYIVEEISRRVSFLAKVVVYPGEDEMSALAEGVIRVLKGEEKALIYRREGSE